MSKKPEDYCICNKVKGKKKQKYQTKRKHLYITEQYEVHVYKYGITFLSKLHEMYKTFVNIQERKKIIKRN